MEFKLITEDSNTEQGSEFKFSVKPGVEMVAHFYGFAVFMRPEGCVLVLPSGIRESVLNMKKGQDRIILLEPEFENKEGGYQTLFDASLEWYPKDEVDPKDCPECKAPWLSVTENGDYWCRGCNWSDDDGKETS